MCVFLISHAKIFCVFRDNNTFLFFLAPSRNLDHQRPWEEEGGYLDSSYSHRSSVGQSTGAIPSYNSKLLL